MKKIVSVFLIICLAVMSLVACGATNKTYYLYEDGKLNKEAYIVIDGDKWTDDDGASGRVEIKGEKIVFYTVLFGEEEELWDGTIKNDTITLSYTIVDTEYEYVYRAE